MYPLIIFISFLQQFRPYFRKHISNSLEYHEYLLLNSLCISFIVIVYLLYLYNARKLSVSKMITNYGTLTLVEIACILMLSLFTIISGMFLFELDKNHNTPLLNSLFVKSAGTIALVCIGIFMFEESYKLHQFIGIGLILIGIYLASSKRIDI